MRLNQPIAMLLAVWIVGAAGSTSLCLGETEAVLPAGVEAVWDLDKAGREKTATRERV